MSSTASPPSSARRSGPPAWAAAAALAALVVVLGPRTADLGAQQYRADLGLVLWDDGWYGGHHMPGYSVLFPPLAALVGPKLVGALAAVAATGLFERLVRGAPTADGGWSGFGGPGARAGALWFAVGMAATLVSGRLTFALGVALGVGAILLAARRRPGLACAAAVATTLASPVAGAFLALGAAAWWLAERGPAPVALGACALAPAALLALAFPEGGSFPFVASSFWPGLAAAIAFALAVPRSERVVRIGAALYVVAMVGAYVLSTPMGGNVMRLGALAAGPLLACLLWRRNPRLLALLALPLAYWQWVAPADDWLRAGEDPSVHAGFYAGLNGFLRAQRARGPFRVEIAFTDNHWESRWVAPVAPLARGWERQLDRHRNALFYDDRPLTAARYRRWLDDNAVRFVALADAPVDYSAAAEAALVRGGLPYLRPVWHDAHWRVWAVRGARPLASGAARVTALDGARVRLRASRGGTVDLRVRFTPYWRLTAGAGCVERARGDWTRLRLARPGDVTLEARLSLRRVVEHGPRCS